jgi:hypothetical protein
MKKEMLEMKKANTKKYKKKLKLEYAPYAFKHC